MLLRWQQYLHQSFSFHESTFNNRGGVNRQNCHYWSKNNPHWLRRIIGNWVIDPYFIKKNLNSETFLKFLQNHLPYLLENVILEVRYDMWFQ
ncbi:hypothetical protein ACFW04_014595 [Cataglyphis niger]